MTASAPVRLGVLGCGWIAGLRLRQIASSALAEVRLVVDPDPRVASFVRTLAPDARVLRALDEDALAGVDGVMISSPSALHAAQSAALLERGIPVFVQKPLALCPDEARRLLGLAAALDLPIGTDLCHRHLTSAEAVRKALADGTIGRVIHVEGCFHNAYRPGSSWSHEASLAGGGALIDLGIHLIDLLMWLTGEPLAFEHGRLLARGRACRVGELEDFAAIELSLPEGARVRLATSWDASIGRDAEIALRLFGSTGTIEIANRAGSFCEFDAHRFRGTGMEVLAQDRGDAWQAGPLLAWLRQIADGAGYREPTWADQPIDLVSRAYRQAQRVNGHWVSPLIAGEASRASEIAFAAAGGLPS